MTYTLPESLLPHHQVETFNCSEPGLNLWLRQRALKSERDGAARTYVVCWENRVVGYYCLATGNIKHQEALGKVKRNMPDPIPVIVLGRLAVDIGHQRQNLGKGLVKDAILRTLQASEIVGIRAILVHALNEEAKRFYVEKCGFSPSPVHPLTLMVTLAEVKNNFGI